MSGPRLSPPVSVRGHTQGPADAPALLVVFGSDEFPLHAPRLLGGAAGAAGPGRPVLLRLPQLSLDKIHLHALDAALVADA